MAFEYLQKALTSREQDNLQRLRFSLPRGQGTTVDFQGKTFLNFSSNDYLGMASHPQVIKAGQNALEQYGVGSGGSPLVTGYSHCQRELEEYLSDWLGVERCLLFNSGFAANTGVIQTLMKDPKGLVIQDKLNHASLIDAGLSCAAKSVRYKHNDMNSLEQRLQDAAPDKLVVTEGVFSMDGDTAPLVEIEQRTHVNKSWLMIDDAHGFGVLGEQGKGTANSIGIPQNKVDIHMATFGKAIGTGGAFVGASSDTIEYLVQFCRHYIYSTAMPPALAAATLASLRCMAQEQWRRDKLNKLIGYFKAKKRKLGLAESASTTAIQPIIIGDAAKTLQISDQLKKTGIWLTAIRPPTVAANTSRLRVTICCDHSEADIDKLFNVLEPMLCKP
jgi:8-amino-7-oxononanoate synthase